MSASSATNLIRLSLVLAFLLSSKSALAAGAEMKPEASDQQVAASMAAPSVDELFDLKRLTSGQMEPQLHGQGNVGPQQTRVSYRDIPLNLADLMLAAPSMPAGRRRLDTDASDIRLVGGVPALDDQTTSPFNELLPYQQSPETLLTAAAINRGRKPHWDDQLSGIVDRGAPSGPDARLLARLANDNYNRLALASAVRRQQASNAAAAKQRSGSGRMEASQSRKRQRAMRDSTSGQAEQGDGQVDDEFDELSSRSDASRNEDELDEDSAGDEEADERQSAGRRSADSSEADPFFNEQDEAGTLEERRDDTNNNELNSEQLARRQTSAARYANQVGAQRRQATNNNNNKRRASVQQRNMAGRRQEQNNQRRQLSDVDDEIDSMNSRRQQFVAASRRQLGANNGDANSINSLELSPNKRRSMGSRGATQFNAARNSNNNANKNSADLPANVDDSDLSASHIRNSATDLQAAAGHHHGHGHGHYYQHVEVPKKKAWKFGFKRGNHKHEIEKHEKGYKHKFHTQFKWHAKEKCKKKSKCESVGKMTWEYKHHDKKHHP